MKSSLSSASKKPLLKRKGFWAVVVLLIAAAGGAGWYFLVGARTVEAQSALQTAAAGNTTTVQRGDLKVTVTGSGTLSAAQTADLSFSTGGTVSTVNVKLGDMVAAGEALAQIDSAPALQNQIASLKLQLLQAQQDLTSLQTNADVSLATAYQNYVTAKAAYNDAVTAQEKTAYARCSQTVATKYKAAMDLAQANLNQLYPNSYGTDAWINATNNLNQAKANYSYCTSYSSDEKTEALAKVNVTKTSMDQANTKYQTLQKALGVDPNQLAVAQAKVESLQTQLDKANEDLQGTTLTAPFAGKVIYLASGAGTMVGTSKFITIADVSHLEVNANVDESDMDKFAVGESATITFDALPDQTFIGKVTEVQPSLTTSGQYKVLQGAVTLDDSAAQTVKDMPLGLNATVSILYKEAKNVLLVPVTAMKEISGKGYEVAVMNSDGTSQLKSVKVGLIGTTYAEVTSGLNEGETIVKIIENSSTTRSKNNNQGGVIFFEGPSGAGGPPPGQ